MKQYSLDKIRNIGFFGGSGAGKTTLAEHLFNYAKMTSKIGKIEDGNTVLDFDPEEIERKMSLMTSLGFVDWKDWRINIVDTPGNPDMIGDQTTATAAVETAVVVANATGGFEVGLEQALELLESKKIGKALLVNRMDSENADFNKVIELIYENMEIKAVPVMIPIGAEGSFRGVVDLVKQKAYIDNELTDIPADLADVVEEKRMELMESIAETDEALLDIFLEEMELSEENMVNGIKKAVVEGNLMPAFACSATTSQGIKAFIEGCINYLPSPADAKEITIIEKGEEKQMIVSPDGDLLGYIFKSIADPVMGDIAYVRVFSGTLSNALDVLVPEKDGKDKVGNMFYIMGKNRKDTTELKAGEIGGLVKLKTAKNLCSMVNLNSKIQYPAVELPSPVYWQAIRAANQSDEDKIGEALNKLSNEDPTIRTEINAETHENVVSGMGSQQIALLQKKLKARYKVEALLQNPRVAYKETLTGSSDVKYRHKKQSGGKGQFGEVYFRVKPRQRGEGFEFINAIVGGVIPSNYIPAVEKGLHESLKKGIVAGYEIVDISVELYFGSYHDVDSSEMAFKIASSQCLKLAFDEAKPVLLEPIMIANIIIPNEYMGDVMGDISTRRGKIMGMEQIGRKQILKAQLPQSELFAYFPSLKSLTQGRGRFTNEFSHYERVPADNAKKIIAEANSDHE